MCITANVRQLLTGGIDRRLNVWDLATGDLLNSYEPVTSPYPGGKHSSTSAIASSADGKTVLAWGGMMGGNAFVYRLSGNVTCELVMFHVSADSMGHAARS